MCYEVEHYKEFLNTFNILCFLGTWTDTVKQFSFDSYMCFDSIRMRHARVFQNSDGTAVFMKNSLCKLFAVTHLKSTSDNRLWLKFDGNNALCVIVIITLWDLFICHQRDLLFKRKIFFSNNSKCNCIL